MSVQITPPPPLVFDRQQAQTFKALREAFQAATPEHRCDILHDQSTAVRRSILEMIRHAGQGHIGGDFSATDILTTLFVAVLKVRPEDPTWPERDRVIMSKGHSCASLYSELALAGFFPPNRLDEFMDPLSPLNGHPNRNKVPGVETNTGALGHGLPVAVGLAIGAKISGRDYHTYVVTGDGELQEGSNWEALMVGARYGLERLTLIVDRNRLQQGARTEETSTLDPLDQKLAAFNWEVRVIDGHDFGQLLAALTKPGSGRPVAVIANTIKGKGVSFIEDRVEWHHKVPTEEQFQAALEELV